MKRPNRDVFLQQLGIVANYAELRADRASEILAQIGPMKTLFGAAPFLRPERTRATLELLRAAHRFAFFVEQRLKLGLACRRPQK